MLTWPARRGTSYFLLEIYQRDRLVHATTVRARAFAVPTWLRAGRYEWRVFAGVGSPEARKISGVVERGWFVVT